MRICPLTCVGLIFISFLSQASAQTPVASGEEVSGEIEISVADDFVNHSSHRIWRLTTAAGTEELLIDASTIGIRNLRRGTTIRATGVREGGHLRIQRVVPQATAPVEFSTTGPQKVAVLMVATPSNPTFPSGWDASTVGQAFFGTDGLTLNIFLQDASYGQTSAAGQVLGPIALTSDIQCIQTSNWKPPQSWPLCR